MKYFFLVLISVFFVTIAVEVTDDVNSQLVSYLLAKVQRLEAKMMAKPNVRNTREVEKRSVDTNTSADDKKTKDCPQQVVTYIRWGNSTCPYGANIIYKGVAAGGRHNHKGAPSNMMCLPLNGTRYLNSQGGSYRAYAVEYQVGGIHNHANCHNMPCALCEVTGRVNRIMVPSHYECPYGWHKEYNGYIMSGSLSQEGSSMFHCIDESLEQVKSSGACENVHLLGTIFTDESSLLHEPNSGGQELPCVVCTK